jgi:2-aminoadipate transaminase
MLINMSDMLSEKMKSLHGNAVREILSATMGRDIIAFSAGNPDTSTFPLEAMAEASAEIFASDPQAFQYGVSEGYEPLRNKIKERLADKFGMIKDGDELIMLTGGQQGLDLVARTLCNEGDTVICETPSFVGALNSFRSYGAKLAGIPMRHDGMDVSLLEEALKSNKNVKFIYIISAFQNPTGITTSLERRREILALAKKYGVFILEDNPYGELRFSGEDVPTFKALDNDGLVIYCSSFSKILSSGMRMGYLVAQREVMKPIILAKQCADVHTNLFFQKLCYKILCTYDMDAHIKKICGLYGRKCHLMMDMLDKYMPESVTHTRPEGGLFLWCELPEERDSAQFAKFASERDVFVVPGFAFAADMSAPSHAFRMNYSSPTEAQIEKGVKILAEAAHDFLATK